MKNEKIKSWIKAAGVRALKTMAQTAAATIGTAAVLGDVNWIMTASASLLAGILSLLTSIAGLPELKEEQTLFSDKAIEMITSRNLNECDSKRKLTTEYRAGKEIYEKRT